MKLYGYISNDSINEYTSCVLLNASVTGWLTICILVHIYIFIWRLEAWFYTYTYMVKIMKG